MFSAFGPPMVGLDIGSTTLRAAALRRRRSGWALVAAREAPLPEPPLDDAPESGPVVGAALSELLAAMGIERARVATAIAGHVVIVRRLSVSAATRAELASVVGWEAEQYVPFDPADVRIDYEVVDEEGEAGVHDVLLVAARDDRVRSRAALVESSGHTPVVIDIEAFALANAHQLNYPEHDDGLSVLVHAGRHLLVVCLVEAGTPVFTRDISAGTQLHLDSLQRELGPRGVDDLAARHLLYGAATSGISAHEIESVLSETSAQLAQEVRKTVEFHRGRAASAQVARVVLSGGACRVIGLVDALARELDAPVELFDPFRRIRHRAQALPPAVSRPAYAVAIGLAMRGREGR